MRPVAQAVGQMLFYERQLRMSFFTCWHACWSISGLARLSVGTAAQRYHHPQSPHQLPGTRAFCVACSLVGTHVGPSHLHALKLPGGEVVDAGVVTIVLQVQVYIMWFTLSTWIAYCRAGRGEGGQDIAESIAFRKLVELSAIW